MKRPRGTLLLPVVLCAVAGCAGASGDAPAGGSTRLVYRIDDLAQEPARVSTEVVDVASPQRARSVVHAGESTTGTSLGGVAYSERGQYLLKPDGTSALVQDIAPTFAGPAWHLATALMVAAAHGQATAEGTRTVGTRSCTQWRTYEPLDAGPVRAATATDSATSCVTEAGLLVQEAWTIDGQVVRRRTLVSAGSGPSLAGDGLFPGPAPSGSPQQAGRETVKDVAVQTLVTALGIPTPAAPLGLPVGRSVAVIQLDPGGAGVAVEGGVLSWGQGDRLVLLRVERGLTRRLTVGTDGTAVTVGGRTVRVQAVAAGVKVRLAGPQGLVATVTADVPERDLLAWLGTLSLG